MLEQWASNASDMSERRRPTASKRQSPSNGVRAMGFEQRKPANAEPKSAEPVSMMAASAMATITMAASANRGKAWSGHTCKQEARRCEGVVVARAAMVAVRVAVCAAAKKAAAMVTVARAVARAAARAASTGQRRRGRWRWGSGVGGGSEGGAAISRVCGEGKQGGRRAHRG